MSVIHHVVTGNGEPPLVFVHGFGCDHTDWDAQVAHFSSRHRTVAVDLRGHGTTPGDAPDCSVERYGADIAELLRALDLKRAILVGHSMGCRVVTEAALQAPDRTAAVVLLDGSQFAPAMGPVLWERFATAEGYTSMVNSMFVDMFTPASDPALVATVVDRAGRLSRSVGAKMLTDMHRYDVGRFNSALGCLTVPVLVVQATYSNEKRERRPMQAGQTTPYLDMIRAAVPSARVEIIRGTGHFPQMEASAGTNDAIESFVQATTAA